MCSMYENIDDGAFIGRKQYSVLMFKVNFLGLGLLSSSFFFLFLFFLVFFFSIYIYIYLKHNASLTHVTSFRLMTPKPVGLRALGVETPFELNNSGYRYWYVNSAMFNSLKLFSFFFGKLTYVLKEEDTNIIRGIPQIYNDNRNIKQQMATG